MITGLRAAAWGIIVGFAIYGFILFVATIHAKADELDDAYQTCLPHKNDIRPSMVMQDGHRVVDATAAHQPLFQPGWEQCLVIHRAWLQRSAAPVAAPPGDPPPIDQETPEHQKTTDLAKKLVKPPTPRPDATLPQ